MKIENRFDFFFSYWILTWFFLYYFKIVKSNPKLLILIGLIANVVTLSTIIYYRNSLNLILGFIIVNICIKVIPLYLLRNTRTHTNDILWYVLIFLIYCLWMYLNGINLIDFLKNNFNSIKNKKYDPPIVHIVRKYFQ